MEAMAAGKIVLARFDSNLTGTIVNGKTGYFFTDDASFVSQVEKIFSLNKEQKQAHRKDQRTSRRGNSLLPRLLRC